MGRLHHLKKTLPQNILDNNTQDTQFVLLDYNSKDDVEKWIKSNCMPFIKSGKLLYAKEKTAAYFHMSHAKNIAANLCSGEIICSVDADTYTGPAMNLTLNNMFRNDKDMVVRFGNAGIIAITKSNFIKLGGYDEEFQGWGYEDDDLIRRGIRMGLSQKAVDSPEFGRRIFHSRYEQIINYPAHINKASNTNIKILRSHDLHGLIIVNSVGFAKAKLFINFSPYSKAISCTPPVISKQIRPLLAKEYVIHLCAPRYVLDELRFHGWHSGYLRNHKNGIDKGLIRICHDFIDRYQRIQALAKILFILQREAASIHQGVAVIWHPEIDITMVRAATSAKVIGISVRNIKDANDQWNKIKATFLKSFMNSRHSKMVRII
jgi:hypothetical protein